jgi:hypothetical protein
MRTDFLTTSLVAACLLLVALVTPATADGAKGEECAAKVRDFARDLDYVMSLEQRSTNPLNNILQKYFPTEGCRVDEAIAIARQSKFFWETYETVTDIGVHFRNETLKAGFGVERESGNIVRPYVTWRVPYP